MEVAKILIKPSLIHFTCHKSN